MKRYIVGSFLLGLIMSSAFSQSANNDLLGREDVRLVTSAVPFLLFAPDARSSAMGDVGVATSPDPNAMYWNASKLAFTEDKTGGSLSYTPWLRKLVNDMFLGYLSGYTKLSDEQAIGISLRYFDLGSMTFTDNEGETIKVHEPKEYEWTVAYSRKLSSQLGMAIGLKYIRSNLTGGVSNSGASSQPGNAAAGDVSLYYQGNEKVVFGYPVKMAGGLAIQNIGSKISYGGEPEFLPGNFRLGFSGMVEIDQYNSITLAVDVNKMLVPTPPVYAVDSSGQIVIDANGDQVIESGKDPDRSYMSGVFGSFTDAPDGFSEEMQEFTLSAGLEYWYAKLFAVRGGYFTEHRLKGNRKYFTAGIGIKYQLLEIDMSYLIPVMTQSPLADTLRFTLLVSLGDSKDAGSVTDGQ